MIAVRPALWLVVRVVAVVYGIVMLVAWLVSDRLIFQPRPASYGLKLPGVQQIPAADGTPLGVLYLPNSAARLTVFYFHGNAEDLGDCVPLLDEMRGAGFAVLAFDYRGYGLSQGKPGEDNVYADTQTVLAYAEKTWGVRPGRVLAVGRSVGTGPAVELATRTPVAGLVLISPLASAFRVMTRVKLLPFDRFDNLGKASRVRCPALVFHGTADEVIPFADGEKLFAVLPEPKRNVWLPGVGHNDIFAKAGRKMLKDIVAFAETLPAETKR